MLHKKDNLQNNLNSVEGVVTECRTNYAQLKRSISTSCRQSNGLAVWNPKKYVLKESHSSGPILSPIKKGCGETRSLSSSSHGIRAHTEGLNSVVAKCNERQHNIAGIDTEYKKSKAAIKKTDSSTGQSPVRNALKESKPCSPVVSRLVKGPTGMRILKLFSQSTVVRDEGLNCVATRLLDQAEKLQSEQGSIEINGPVKGYLSTSQDRTEIAVQSTPRRAGSRYLPGSGKVKFIPSDDLCFRKSGTKMKHCASHPTANRSLTLKGMGNDALPVSKASSFGISSASTSSFQKEYMSLGYSWSSANSGVKNYSSENVKSSSHQPVHDMPSFLLPCKPADIGRRPRVMRHIDSSPPHVKESLSDIVHKSSATLTSTLSPKSPISEPDGLQPARSMERPPPSKSRHMRAHVCSNPTGSNDGNCFEERPGKILKRSNEQACFSTSGVLSTHPSFGNEANVLSLQANAVGANAPPGQSADLSKVEECMKQTSQGKETSRENKQCSIIGASLVDTDNSNCNSMMEEASAHSSCIEVQQKKMISLRVPQPPNLSQLPEEMDKNDPDSVVLWKGCFEIFDGVSHSHTYDGIYACPPTQVSRKALDTSRNLPANLQFKLVSRQTVWPERFKENPPSYHDIALYFFPGDVNRSRQKYYDLLERIIDLDLALEHHIDGADLLIFTSKQLPLVSKSSRTQRADVPLGSISLYEKVSRSKRSYTSEC